MRERGTGGPANHSNLKKLYLPQRLILDATRKIAGLSFGSNKKVGIISALLHTLNSPLVNLFVVGFAAIGLSLLPMLPITQMAEVYVQIAWSGPGMFFTQCLRMSLGLLCSALLKTYRSAALSGAAVLLASYGLMLFVQIQGQASLNFLSPLTFFGAAEVTAYWLNGVYLLLCATLIALCVRLTQKLYRRKAIVV